MEILDIVLLSISILSFVVGITSIMLALYTMNSLRKFSNSTKWGLGRIKNLIAEANAPAQEEKLATPTSKKAVAPKPNSKKK